MPTYDFRCNRCGEKFTVMVKISEKESVVCPKCQSKEISQLFTGCAIHTGSCGSEVATSSGG